MTIVDQIGGRRLTPKAFSGETLKPTPLVSGLIVGAMEKPMQTEKVHLTKEKETLLATLYARALESRSPDPISDASAGSRVRLLSRPAETESIVALSVLAKVDGLQSYSPPNYGMIPTCSSLRSSASGLC